MLQAHGGASHKTVTLQALQRWLLDQVTLELFQVFRGAASLEPESRTLDRAGEINEHQEGKGDLGLAEVRT
jgi:hypothetical protein